MTARQQTILERITRRASSAQQVVARATLVLAAVAGENNAQAGRRAGVSRETARRWRERWAAAGEVLLAADLEGAAGTDRTLEAVILGVLADEPRPGAPAPFTPERLCRSMALAGTPPAEAERPIAHRTPRALADEAARRGIVARISATAVGRFSQRGRPPAAPQPLRAHARVG